MPGLRAEREWAAEAVDRPVVSHDGTLKYEHKDSNIYERVMLNIKEAEYHCNTV